MEKKLFDLSDEPSSREELPLENAPTAEESQTPAPESTAPAASVPHPTQQIPYGYYDPRFAQGAPVQNAPYTPPAYTPPTSPYTPPSGPNVSSVRAPKAGKKKHTALAVFLAVMLFLLGIAAGFGFHKLAPLFSAYSGNITYPDDAPEGDEGNGGSEGSDPSQKVPNDQNLPASGEMPDFTRGNFQPTFGDKENTYTPAEIYANCVEAVVGISTEITTQNAFGQEISGATSGSGFFCTKDGYILTNCHVVDGAHSVTVTTYDERQYTAAIVGKDRQNDVALLKIEPEGEVKFLTMGKSADMVVGEEILVIGNPLGELTHTLTRGIVSNLSRDIYVEENLNSIRMFQTDAAINGGNSGGPAIDSHGNVIGIVSAKYASSSIEGLGFCIPIDDALIIAHDLDVYEYVRGRAQLGIEGVSVSGYVSRDTYLVGVRVETVNADSCAEKGGLKPQDIITHLDGAPIEDIYALKSALAAHKASDTITLSVYRDGETVEISVVLDEAKG